MKVSTHIQVLQNILILINQLAIGISVERLKYLLTN